jgi:hypothetical protein
MAKNQSFFKVNGYCMMAFMPLHEDLEGDVRNVRLTIEAVDMAEGDDVDRENLQSFDETLSHTET